MDVGIEMPVSVTKTPLRDKTGRIVGIPGTSRYLTDLNQRPKSLQKENKILKKQLKDLTIQCEKEKERSYKANQLLNIAIKTARNAMFFIDARTTKIIDCSHSASEIFGFRRKEMIGNTVDFLHVSNSHLKEFREQLQTGINQKGCLFLPCFEMKRKDGKIFLTEHSVFPIKNRQGKISKWVSIVRDQTERKWAENALKETQDRYQMLIETMTDSLGIIDENGRIIYVNDKAINMIGYSHKELIGRSPLELLDTANQNIFNDQQKKRSKGERSSYELTWTRKDGQKVHTIVSPRDIYNGDGGYKGTFAVITDITARKQIEEELRESEEKYRSGVEFADVYISVVDKNCVYQFLNQKLSARHAMTKSKRLGQNYSEFHGKKQTEDFANKVKEVFDTGKPVSYEYQSEIDGRFFLVTNSPIKDSKGQVILATTIGKDITERKQLEKSLKEQTEKLQIKSQDLEELNIALKVLLNKREKDNIRVQEKVLANVNQLIEPTMQKLKQSRLDQKQKVLINILESNLAEIVSSFPKALSSKYLILTATEIQIANLLKQGKTSKEMAEILNLSQKTIQTHRRNIRKKIGLNGKKTNLRSYLLTMQE